MLCVCVCVCVTFCQYQALVTKRLAKLVAKPLTKRFSIGFFCFFSSCNIEAFQQTLQQAERTCQGASWDQRQPSKNILPGFRIHLFDMINYSVLWGEMGVFSWIEGCCVLGLMRFKRVFRPNRFAVPPTSAWAFFRGSVNGGFQTVVRVWSGLTSI